MLEGKKISELDTVTNLQTGCCFPILSKGATKRITFGSLLSEIKGNLPETGIEEVKEDVQTLKTRADEASENINTLTADVENIKTEVADVDEMVAGQNATIRNCVSTVEGLEQRIEQTHFDDVLELEEQVRANAANVEKKLDKTTSASNAGKAVVVDENGNLVFGAAGVQVSHIEGNAIEEKQDGIYVETVNVSEEEGNALEEKEDGLYVSQAAAGLPIGTIVSWSSDNVPAGFLKFDGTTYNKSDYPVLFTRIPDEWKIDENTFKLPDLKDKFIQGANNNLGESIEAGLPNITGSINSATAEIVVSKSGALDKSRIDTANDRAAGSKGRTINIVFDAADGETDTDGNLKTDESTKVYGKSNTVQPPAVALNFIIKATNYTEPQEEVIDDTRATTGNVWSASKTKAEIENRTSLDWNNAVETVATNTNENTFNVTTDGVLFYDLSGFYGNNCYVKINDITIAFGASNGNNWIVSKNGSCIVSEGDVIKWKEGYVGDWMSTHKIIFVPYKS